MDTQDFSDRRNHSVQRSCATPISAHHSPLYVPVQHRMAPSIARLTSLCFIGLKWM